MVAPYISLAVLMEHDQTAVLGESAKLVDEIPFDFATASVWGADAVVLTNPTPLHVSTWISSTSVAISLPRNR